MREKLNKRVPQNLRSVSYLVDILARQKWPSYQKNYLACEREILEQLNNGWNRTRRPSPTSDKGISLPVIVGVFPRLDLIGE